MNDKNFSKTLQHRTKRVTVLRDGSSFPDKGNAFYCYSVRGQSLGSNSLLVLAVVGKLLPRRHSVRGVKLTITSVWCQGYVAWRNNFLKNAFLT